VLLITGYLAALAVGAYELQRGPALSLPPQPPEQAAQTLPPLEVPPEVINSLAAYDAIVERPLFYQDRRPPASDPAEPQTTAEQVDEGAVEIDGFRLTAVLQDGDNITVLIEDRTGQTRTLHQGDRLGNWQLGEILDDRVVLIADGRRETLLVYDFAAPVAAARPPRSARRIPRRTQARVAPADRSPVQKPDQ